MKRPDVAALMKKLAHKPAEANRTFGVLRKIFNLAEVWGLGSYAEGPYAEFDFHSDYLKHLSGFIGLSDIEHIRVEGLSYGPETAEGAIANARTAMATPLAKAA